MLITSHVHFSRMQRNRVTILDDKIDADMCHNDVADGVYLGFWDETELDAWKTS